MTLVVPRVRQLVAVVPRHDAGYRLCCPCMRHRCHVTQVHRQLGNDERVVDAMPPELGIQPLKLAHCCVEGSAANPVGHHLGE